MLRGGMGAEKPPGSRAKQEPHCQGLVQVGVRASVSTCAEHPTPGDVRGHAASLPPCLTTTAWVGAVLLGLHVPLTFTSSDVI